jgi:ferredoxin-NADP reductase
LNKPDWKDKQRPFTFTSLPNAKTLEFIIKVYDDHDGVTKQLGLAKKGDELAIGEPFGAIHYQGPGFFFAAGCRGNAIHCHTARLAEERKSWSATH